MTKGSQKSRDNPKYDRNSKWKGETSNEYWWIRGEEGYSDEDWVDRVEREEWNDRGQSYDGVMYSGAWGCADDRDCDPEYRY